jgi:hypothetical protein
VAAGDAGVMGFLGGVSGTSSDPTISQSPTGTPAGSGLVHYKTAFKLISTTQIQFITIPVGYVGSQSNSSLSPSGIIASLDTTIDEYLTLWHRFSAAATTTVTAVNLQVTLKTCG